MRFSFSSVAQAGAENVSYSTIKVFEVSSPKGDHLDDIIIIIWFATNKADKTQHVIRERKGIHSHFKPEMDVFLTYWFMIRPNSTDLFTCTQWELWSKYSLPTDLQSVHLAIISCYTIIMWLWAFCPFMGGIPVLTVWLGCLSILWPSLQSLTAGNCNKCLRNRRNRAALKKKRPQQNSIKVALTGKRALTWCKGMLYCSMLYIL